MISGSDIKIIIAGDTSGWNLGDNIEIDEKLKNYIQESDIFIFNFEGVVCNQDIGKRLVGYPKNKVLVNILKLFKSNQPPVYTRPEQLQLFRLGKINVATLAGNHVLDNGRQGVVSTKNHLSSAGFYALGAGKNIKEANKCLILEVKGRKIGIVNINLVGWRYKNFFYDAFRAHKSKPGAAAFNNLMKNNIRKMVSKVDHSIAVVHIGRVITNEVCDYEIPFFDELVNMGVNTIAAHHSHSERKTALSKNGCIYYGLGNFLFNHNEEIPLFKKGMLSQIVIKDNKVEYCAIKTNNNYGLPSLKGLTVLNSSKIVQ